MITRVLTDLLLFKENKKNLVGRRKPLFHPSPAAEDLLRALTDRNLSFKRKEERGLCQTVTCCDNSIFIIVLSVFVLIPPRGARETP